MEYKKIYLKRGKEESLRRFHPWVFSGAIHHADRGIGEGDVVRVFDSNDEFIAVGHYQIGTIAVRVLSFRDVPIDDDFWYSRLKAAYDMRVSIGRGYPRKPKGHCRESGEGDGRSCSACLL